MWSCSWQHRLDTYLVIRGDDWPVPCNCTGKKQHDCQMREECWRHRAIPSVATVCRGSYTEGGIVVVGTEQELRNGPTSQTSLSAVETRIDSSKSSLVRSTHPPRFSFKGAGSIVSIKVCWPTSPRLKRRDMESVGKWRTSHVNCPFPIPIFCPPSFVASSLAISYPNQAP